MPNVHPNGARRVSALLPAFFLVVTCLGATPAGGRADRDALWDIVSDCLNPQLSERGSCESPRDDDIVATDPRCMTTTQVWTQNDHYVAIRDEKMCNCPATFVHGLALPFARLAGTEAKDLPEGIWPFAWEAARARIAEESAIALVVNPPSQRTQDQLHIHLVRLRAGARKSIAARSAVTVPSLDAVWETANKIAAERRLKDYGVVVTSAGNGTFALLVSDFVGAPPEMTFTQYRCK